MAPQYWPWDHIHAQFPTDPSTGLPTVPIEGTYWKISQDSVWVYIALMQPRRFWFDKKIKWTLTKKVTYTHTRLYTDALQLIHGLLQEQKVVVDKFPKSGKYPPNKLEKN